MNFFKKIKVEKPLIIAGPCSAESQEQVLSVAHTLVKSNVDILRFGVWKPRTSPGSFEGFGEKALPWLNQLKKEIQKPIAIEVANAQHVELALKHNIDVLWLGARTTVNPFTVQEIADALRGVNIPVLIKNPVNPDLKLWIGAVERLQGANLTSLGVIHRGFSSYGATKYRNEPYWQIPIAFRHELPEIPIIVDPSHICGTREFLHEIAQKALDLDFDGLMLETHPNPDNALSDPLQQINVKNFDAFLNTLKVRKGSFDDKKLIDKLTHHRSEIDQIDAQIIDLFSDRMKIVEKIGHYKKQKNVTIFQSKRWDEILLTRSSWASHNELSPEFIQKIYRLIHDESLKIQTEIYHKDE